jgi:uracil-DNA glycosylase
MEKLLRQIKQCKECEHHLPLGANPIIAASTKSKILIIGQAPGKIVHTTGIPWNDKSGDNLRKWLGVDKASFYNADLIALMPMGFCYPGKSKTGDLPPRPECAPLWHAKVLALMKQVKLTLLIGQYAQNYYLNDLANQNLTDTVKTYKKYLPQFFPLPHPSPRNNIWQARNEWFIAEVVPELRKQVQRIF